MTISTFTALEGCTCSRRIVCIVADFALPLPALRFVKSFDIFDSMTHDAIEKPSADAMRASQAATRQRQQLDNDTFISFVVEPARDEGSASIAGLNEAASLAIVNRALINLHGLIGGAMLLETAHFQSQAHAGSASGLLVLKIDGRDAEKLLSAAAFASEEAGVGRLRVLAQGAILEDVLPPKAAAGLGSEGCTSSMDTEDM